MNKWIWLLVLVALYTLFSVILYILFNNTLSILAAGMIASIVGLVISLMLKEA